MSNQQPQQQQRPQQQQGQQPSKPEPVFEPSPTCIFLVPADPETEVRARQYLQDKYGENVRTLSVVKLDRLHGDHVIVPCPLLDLQPWEIKRGKGKAGEDFDDDERFALMRFVDCRPVACGKFWRTGNDEMDGFVNPKSNKERQGLIDALNASILAGTVERDVKGVRKPVKAPLASMVRWRSDKDKGINEIYLAAV